MDVNKFILGCIVMPLSVSSAAFTTSPSALAGDSTSIPNHELGLGLNPLVSMIVQNSNDVVNYSLIYKKRIRKGKAFLRVNPAVFVYNNRMTRPRKENYSASESYYQDASNYYLISQTDSSQVRRYFSNENNPKLKVGLGVEKRFGKRAVRWYYGADIIASRHKSSSRVDQYYFYEAGTATNNNGHQSIHFNPDFDHPETYPVSEIITTSTGIGLRGIFGIRIPIVKHFVFSAEVNPEAAVSFDRLRNADSSSLILLSNRSNFNFDQGADGGLINFYLTYAFGK